LSAGVRFTLAALVWLAGPQPRAEAAEIVDLIPLIKNDKVRVSFVMSEAFSEEVERAIASGLPVSFNYTVELKKVRTLWLNQKLTTRSLQTTVSYDNLAQRYKVSLELDGQILLTQVLADPEAMRRFMTRFENLELFSTSLLEPNGEYYLRVKGVIRERNFMFFIPWDVGSGWKKSYFTFIP
jgi:hypothetical protein